MNSSHTLNFLIKIWTIIIHSYNSSYLKEIVSKTESKISFLIRGSSLYNFVTTDKSLFEESFIYKIYCSFIESLSFLFRRIREVISKYKDYSIIFKAISGLAYIKNNIMPILSNSIVFRIAKNIFLIEDCKYKEVIKVNWGILLAIVLVPFAPKMVSLLFIIFIVFMFLVKQLYRQDLALRKDFIDIPIILLVISMVITTISSYNPQGSIRDLVIHLAAIGFLFVAVNSVKTKNQFNIILTTFIFTAALVSLYGLYQYKVGVELDKAWVDTANNPELTTRVFSVFGNPNILAEYLIMAIPLSLSLLWTTKGLFKRAVFLMTTLTLVFTLILTFSRGGWLGFAFGLFIFVLLLEKRLLLSLIPVGIISIFIMPSSVIHRITTIGNLRDSSNAYRIKVWEITLDMIRDNWISGVGFGYIPFRETFVKYIRTMNVYHAHNMYLETMTEMGIGGFILLIVMLFVIYKYAILTLRKVDDKYIRVVTIGTLASLSSILCHGLVENVLYLPRIIITFWTIVSFILVLLNISKKENANQL